MKKILIILCGLISAQTSQALTGSEYMERFNTYIALSQKLPITPTPIFLEFVKERSPLSNKLRERWLYELARTKDWTTYNQYYQPSNDLNLVCYEQIAKYNLGAHQEALKDSIPVWLSGESQPPACNNLFDLLMRDENFNQNLISQRIALALDRRNIQLARYLLKQYKTPHPADIQALNTVVQSPSAISKLHPGGLNGEFYLYGLKRMVSINMDKALQLWQQSKTSKMLNQAQQQEFLAHVALYKAMRNSEDTSAWFAKVTPQHYNDTLLDWEIRYALKRNDWKEVSTLIANSKNKEAPCWQYWLGRSLEEQGKTAEARTVYEPLAKSRQYYGFLASLRLKQTPNFVNEAPIQDLDVLKPYQSVLDQVKSLYQNKNTLPASRLLNDFISELPKDEASALVYWIDTNLQWHGKSVYLSNTDRLNNQLILRFPLAYKTAIKQYSKKYAVSPEFIYAIIRQESGFREDATSTVGARGLMQVMPYTAGVVSKADRISYQNKDQLFLSEKNINIGVAYLKQLAKRFDNHPILMAAAYNAGPKQVVYWLKNHPPKEIDVWIETLPWQETRNYLKNVMAFYVVYQYRLNQKPNLARFLEPL
ncbi:transglycosylase SLT domain-containing protein [Legionella lytica]|uniref:Transglycosylase SLT domain-containing protein n=1 Tax=Legionella lytica TaxID=96232 RepID=A0ABW8DAP3_9GAMM